VLIFDHFKRLTILPFQLCVLALLYLDRSELLAITSEFQPTFSLSLSVRLPRRRIYLHAFASLQEKLSVDCATHRGGEHSQVGPCPAISHVELNQ